MKEYGGIKCSIGGKVINNIEMDNVNLERGNMESKSCPVINLRKYAKEHYWMSGGPTKGQIITYILKEISSLKAGDSFAVIDDEGIKHFKKGKW